MFEELKASDFWRQVQQTQTVQVTAYGNVHAAGCDALELPGLTKEMPLYELDLNFHANCCRDKLQRSPEPDTSRLVRCLVDADKDLQNGAVSLKTVAFFKEAARHAVNPLLANAAKEAAETGLKKLQTWVSSPEAEEFADLVGSCVKHPFLMRKLVRLEATSDLPKTIKDIYALAGGGDDAELAELERHHESRPRPEGFLFAWGSDSLEGRAEISPSPLINDFFTRFKVTANACRIPRRFEELAPSSFRGYGELLLAQAPLEPGDTDKVIETASVLLLDGYSDADTALKAARALEL